MLHRLYETGEDELEWELVYAAPSDVPEVIKLRAEFPAGTVAHYQPALTPEEIAEGCERPEEMVGGYVFFVPGEGRWLDRGRNEIVNYETGRFGHLRRPWVEDRTGRRVWCDWEAVDVSAGVLAIRVPRAFLAEARGPVTVGPTFGYTSIGATASSFSSNYVCAFGPHSPASDGDATSVTAYIRQSEGHNGTYGIYDKSGSYPNNLLGDSAGAALPNTLGWDTQNLDSSVSVTSGTDYFLAWCSGSGTETRYDSVAGFQVDYDSYTYVDGVLSDPFSRVSGNANRKYSIYATYTEAAGGIPAHWNHYNRMAGAA